VKEVHAIAWLLSEFAAGANLVVPQRALHGLRRIRMNGS
jgi:hypothetical protein